MPTSAAPILAVVLQDDPATSGETLEWIAFGVVLVPVLLLVVGALLAVPMLTAVRGLVRAVRRAGRRLRR